MFRSSTTCVVDLFNIRSAGPVGASADAIKLDAEHAQNFFSCRGPFFSLFPFFFVLFAVRPLTICQQTVGSIKSILLASTAVRIGVGTAIPFLFSVVNV